MMIAKKIETSAGQIYLEDSGDGPPMVMVHGLLASSASFAPLVEALSGVRRVIRFDFPDHGRSSMNASFTAGWQGYAEVLREVVDALELDQFDLCGHSMGGGVAALFASTHRERIKKLVLIDSVTGSFKLPLKGRIPLVPLLGDLVLRVLYGEKTFVDYFRHDVFFDARKLNMERVKEYYTGFNHNRAAVLRGIRATANPGPVVAALAKIEAETIILWGRQDPLIPLYVGNETVRKIKRADLQIIDNCGHSPMEEATGQTAKQLLEFLR